MSSPDVDFDLLLEAPHPVEAEMARDLLAEAGIPTFMHGPDAGMADLGVAVQGQVTRPNLYVPKGARERAQAVLDRAWRDDVSSAELEADSLRAPEPE